jgi:hypothetical protein
MHPDVQAGATPLANNQAWPKGLRWRAGRPMASRPAARSRAGGRIPAAPVRKEEENPDFPGRAAGPAGWACRLGLPAGPAGWACRLGLCPHKLQGAAGLSAHAAVPRDRELATVALVTVALVTVALVTVALATAALSGWRRPRRRCHGGAGHGGAGHGGVVTVVLSRRHSSRRRWPWRRCHWHARWRWPRR